MYITLSSLLYINNIDLSFYYIVVSLIPVTCIFRVANLEYYTILPVCLSYLYHCFLSVVDLVVVHSVVTCTLSCDLVSLSC